MPQTRSASPATPPEASPSLPVVFDVCDDHGGVVKRGVTLEAAQSYVAVRRPLSGICECPPDFTVVAWSCKARLHVLAHVPLLPHAMPRPQVFVDSLAAYPLEIVLPSSPRLTDPYGLHLSYRVRQDGAAALVYGKDGAWAPLRNPYTLALLREALGMDEERRLAERRHLAAEILLHRSTSYPRPWSWEACLTAADLALAVRKSA